MAEDESRQASTTRDALFNGRVLLRLGLWSVAAGIAVAVAVVTANSETGLKRIALTFSGVQGVSTMPARETASRENSEMLRLSETLRQINTDRIRMISRLEAIERHLDDLTGSINRGNASASAPENSAPPATTATTAPPSTPASTPAPASSNIPVVSAPPASMAAAPPASTPAQQTPQPTPVMTAPEAPPPEPPVTKVDFGVDLGSAQTVDGLRALWTQVKAKHGTLLEGMRPIVSIRENSKPGSMELRLVVGPIPSAALAARLCVVMNAAGAICQPAVFDGQRLALR